MKLRTKFKKGMAARSWIKLRDLSHLFKSYSYPVKVRGEFNYFLDPSIRDENFNFYLPNGEMVGHWFEENGRGKMECLVAIPNNMAPLYQNSPATSLLSFTDAQTAMVAKLKFGGDL